MMFNYMKKLENAVMLGVIEKKKNKKRTNGKINSNRFVIILYINCEINHPKSQNFRYYSKVKFKTKTNKTDIIKNSLMTKQMKHGEIKKRTYSNHLRPLITHMSTELIWFANFRVQFKGYELFNGRLTLVRLCYQFLFIFLLFILISSELKRYVSH